MLLNKYFSMLEKEDMVPTTPKVEEMANGDNLEPCDDLVENLNDELLDLETIDKDVQIELDRLQFERLKVHQAQLAYKQRILLRQMEKRTTVPQSQPSNKVLSDARRLPNRNTTEGSVDHRDGDSSFAAGAGDSNERDPCPCTQQRNWDQQCTPEDGSSTPSTCKLCSDDRTFERRSDYKDKSEYSKYTKKDYSSKKSDYPKTIEKTTDAVSSKTTDLTSKKSDYSKYTDTVSKRSEVSKKFELVHRKNVSKNKSEVTCDLKYSDIYSDTENEADETNRLLQLRNSDYIDIVDDQLKIVVALAGYPKSKMRLRQMSVFQQCLTEVIDMQVKAGLLKKMPSFLDYYLNKGAIVCICKDLDTRDWMVRVSPGLQERMCINLILLKAKVKRLCLAVLKIPQTCWPSTAQDVFKLLQYFNPTLKTDLWKIYAQKMLDGVEVTSFLIDRVSGEIIRGPSFKNIIDYEQMEFELTGYTEIYYECLLSDLEEDLSSVASRVKLLEEIKSENATPRTPREDEVFEDRQTVKEIKESESKVTEVVMEAKTHKEAPVEKSDLEGDLQKEVLKKLKDVKYISERDEIINWSDETNFSDQETEKRDQYKEDEYLNEDRNKVISTIAVSEKTESIIESNDNLTIGRNSNLNIDSNRGIAYHRRTNYLHVENELKIAITLEGYPQNKLEGTHIRRLKHLFKEYLHKDMKNQRFANLIIPKFQDIYLSNGAVIYICDSLETKDYLTEVLPKFINSTGLKLTFRDIKNLVRYTRIVMRLPREHAHVESVEILLKLQSIYPKLKPDCWKYYSDVAGKQKRQFGVDPESLEVIKSPDFDPTYDGDKISFRIIDRQKRDVSFEEHAILEPDNDNNDAKRLREIVLKSMYVPIDPEIMNSPLTRIRTNHYSDLIADDLKLYVGPSNYPESRVDDILFHSIKRTLENIALELLEKGELDDDKMPKFHDMYLFDGVIFIICQNMQSRRWIEENLSHVNSKLHLHLKSTEFRGAVGIISMVVKTVKDMDDVIAVLQKQNPRLRTKFWRKISTVKTKTKLDVVLQIDKLSAQVMTSPNFNKFVGSNAIQFKLGHLQSLLKPKASLEELSKMHTKKVNQKSSEKSLKKSKSKVTMQGPKDKSYHDLISELRREYPALKVDDWDMIKQREKSNHKICDLEIDETSAKIIEKEDFKLSMGDEKLFFYTGVPSQRSEDVASVEHESPRSADNNVVVPVESTQDWQKMILKIPMDILPDNKDDLSIIFDLLEDKNPGLNTELWKVYTDSPYPNNGKFTILIDRQSASVIQGKNFDPTIGGEKLKFFF
ncbi:uncharacterized protein LOC126379359 isoform X2 [Pectinophora gossypiella]|uniref:uncharacterized protein LOC126379359 isoform X2 n=1 Tax=Pectinophora gossypiella TaxID=13191 RepID=UPI00214E408F|nr:uncharacterized protein LOC126379359 isoform X2 [Pectinophora gossypiella]